MTLVLQFAMFSVPVAAYLAVRHAGHRPRVVERRLNVVPRAGTKDKRVPLSSMLYPGRVVIVMHRREEVSSAVVLCRKRWCSYSTAGCARSTCQE